MSTLMRMLPITDRAMRGKIAFEPGTRERVALLKSVQRAVVDDVIAKCIAFTPRDAR
jgi:phosphoserine phosphatase